MKRGIKNALKRLAASALAASLCAGMLTVTAFASGDPLDPSPNTNGNPDAVDTNNTVFVYINVTQTAPVEGEAPQFQADADKEEAIDAAKKAADEAIAGLVGAGSGVGDVLNAVDEAVDEAGEEMNAAKAALGELTGKPDSGSAGSEPGDGDEAASAPDAPSEKEAPAAAGPADEEAANKAQVDKWAEQADEINKTIGGLNESAKNANDEVGKLGDASPAMSEAKGELDKAVEGKKQAYTDQKAAAEEAVKTADGAVKEVNQKQTELEQQYKNSLAALVQPGKEPARQAGQSEEDYAAAHQAWEQACEDYNSALETLKAGYDAAAAGLDAERKKAQSELDEANDALTKAQAALDAYHQTVAYLENPDQETPVDEDVKNLLGAYQEAAGAYDAYNEAVDAFNGTINSSGEGETGKSPISSAAEQLNEKTSGYNRAVEGVQEAIDTYNEAVDAYNGQAAGWNSKAMSVPDAQEYLGSLVLTTDEKNAYEAVIDAAGDPEALAKLTNEQIAAYNSFVGKYNDGLIGYQSEQGEKTAALLAKAETYFESRGIGKRIYDSDAWYVYGKLDIDGIFSKSAGDFVGSLTYPFKETLTDGSGWGSHAERDDAFIWSITSYDENGAPVWGVAPGFGLKDGLSHDGIFADTKSVSDLTEAIMQMMSTDKEGFEAYNPKNTIPSENEINPMDHVSKWVLKSGVADCYDVPSGYVTWHLDGYLYVAKLSELVKLQEREENQYQKVEIEVVPVTALDKSNVTPAAYSPPRDDLGQLSMVLPTLSGGSGITFPGAISFNPYKAPAPVEPVDPEYPDPENPGPVEIDGPDVPLSGEPALTEIKDEAVPLAGLLSRADAIGYLWERSGRPEAEPSTFEDVPEDHRWAMAIGWAQDMGIALADADGNFRPDDLLLRSVESLEISPEGEFQEFLNRYAVYAGIELDEGELFIELEGSWDDIIMGGDAEVIFANFFAKLGAALAEKAA